MKNILYKITKSFFCSALVGLFAFQPLYGMISNYGYTASVNAEINANNYTNNGTLLAWNSACINVGTIGGNGTISSDKITIQCDSFDFNGTIKCNGECKIYAKKPFKHTQFRKEGTGNFYVIITPYTFKEYTTQSLISDFSGKLYNQCLTLKEPAIDENLRHASALAVLNALDVQKVLEGIKHEIANKHRYHLDRLDQKHDMTDIYCGLASAGIGIAGLAGTYMLNKHIKKLQNHMSYDSAIALIITSGVLSVFPIALSGQLLLEGLKPQHKEKHEQLLIITQRIDKALATPFIQNVQVSKL
ncbi:hypothetical protein H0X48_04850 [Candidatus Dependentiae bacterium]|nr:hypothetical protein [Candidatus Dependentiae bacterium]